MKNFIFFIFCLNMWIKKIIMNLTEPEEAQRNEHNDSALWIDVYHVCCPITTVHGGSWDRTYNKNMKWNGREENKNDAQAYYVMMTMSISLLFILYSINDGPVFHNNNCQFHGDQRDLPHFKLISDLSSHSDDKWLFVFENMYHVYGIEMINDWLAIFIYHIFCCLSTISLVKIWIIDRHLWMSFPVAWS